MYPRYFFVSNNLTLLINVYNNWGGKWKRFWYERYRTGDVQIRWYVQVQGTCREGDGVGRTCDGYDSIKIRWAHFVRILGPVGPSVEVLELQKRWQQNVARLHHTVIRLPHLLRGPAFGVKSLHSFLCYFQGPLLFFLLWILQWNYKMLACRLFSWYIFYLTYSNK